MRLPRTFIIGSSYEVTHEVRGHSSVSHSGAIPGILHGKGLTGSVARITGHIFFLSVIILQPLAFFKRAVKLFGRLFGLSGATP